MTYQSEWFSSSLTISVSLERPNVWLGKFPIDQDRSRIPSGCADLVNCISISFSFVVVQGGQVIHLWRMDMNFNVVLWSAVYYETFGIFKHGMKTVNSRFYSMMPVWMTSIVIYAHRARECHWKKFDLQFDLHFDHVVPAIFSLL